MTATARRISIDTKAFEAAHGTRPSGHGAWAFCPATAYRRDDYLDACFWHHGMYSAAKKKAIAYFAERGTTQIVVCS